MISSLIRRKTEQEPVETCVDGAFVLVAALFSATFGRASKAGQLKKAVLLFVAAVAVSVLVLGIYFALRGRGYDIGWQQITCLPWRHADDKILGVSASAIHLEAESFGDYGVRIDDSRVVPTFSGLPNCFQGAPSEAVLISHGECQPSFSAPSPPGTVKEQATASGQEGHAVCMKAAILTDESVWYWRSVQYASGELLGFSVFYGGFLGCLAGFAMVWLICKLPINSE
jgi:hypothetical protein